MRIEIDSALLYLNLDFSIKEVRVWFNIRVGRRSWALVASKWRIKQFWSDVRTGEKCPECGKPFWYWWCHRDCIPF